MKLFLAGPLLGTEREPFEEFRDISEQLRARHYDIVSLHEHLPVEHDSRWEEYAKGGLMLMLACEGVILIPGWEGGKLARLECQVADRLNMFVFTVNENYSLDGTKYGNQNATGMEF